MTALSEAAKKFFSSRDFSYAYLSAEKALLDQLTEEKLVKKAEDKV